MQGKIDIDWSVAQVMAILNVTPDSFYRDSRTFTTAEIEARVRSVVSQGASIIDIGGYSSRPGADEITPAEEWRRVERAMRVVRSVAPDMVVSIDSFRSVVVERVVEQFGAVVVNDISAGEQDPSLIALAAKYQLPYIAMHMRGTPQTMQQLTRYDDVVEDVVQYFEAKVSELTAAGVREIILDPGFGFAKSIEQNYALMARLSRLCELGYPVLSGVSRKSMIYKLLDTSAEQSLTGTIALNWESLRQGATILRVHDVVEAVEVVKIFNMLNNIER